MKNLLYGKNYIYSLTSCALFTALIAIGAQFSIPLPLDMRLTLQMPFVFLCGIVLGSKRAVVSTSIYLISGIIGLPVFASFSGGPSCVVKPTFGFIIAFIPAVFVIGLIYEKAKHKNLLICFSAISAGLIIIYIIGILYHFIALTFWMNTPKNFISLFLGAGYALIIPKDLISAGFISIIITRITKYKKDII